VALNPAPELDRVEPAHVAPRPWPGCWRDSGAARWEGSRQGWGRAGGLV